MRGANWGCRGTPILWMPLHATEGNKRLRTSLAIMEVMGAHHGQGAMNIAAAAVLGLVLPPGGHQEILSINIAPVKVAGHMLGCHQWSRLIIVVVVLHWNHWLWPPSVAACLTNTGQRSQERCSQNKLAPAHLCDESCSGMKSYVWCFVYQKAASAKGFLSR